MPKSPSGLRAAAVLAIALSLSAPARADEPRPGSVLVFPAHHADTFRFTCISVTNASVTTPVNALFRYVSSTLETSAPSPARDCKELYRAEYLTPADTVTVLTACHAASADNHGYLLVSAQSPTLGGAVAHDALIGQALFMDVSPGFGGVFSYLPAAYQAVPADGQPTDLDFDGRLDFDGLEYEELPDDLYLDSFHGDGGSMLTLLNLSGDKNAVVSVQLFIWNDNEKALSAQFSFQCWFEKPLYQISAVFSDAFLANNTANDPNELDIDCDGQDDLETGWARVSGLSAFGSFSAVSNPPLLGAATGGKNRLEGGRLLWGSNARSSGSF